MAIDNQQLAFTPYKPDPSLAQQVPQIAPDTHMPQNEGFIPKSGAVAHVLTDALRGFMHGRQVAMDNAQKQANQNISTADYVYKVTQDNYNDLLRQGKDKDSPEVRQAYQAAVGAWQARNHVLGQYVAPEPQGKPKGAGGKVKAAAKGAGKGIFGSVNPEMIPAAAMQILQAQPPPGLGLTTEDQKNKAQADAATAEAANMKTVGEAEKIKLEEEKKNVALKDQWTTISQIPPEQQTPADKQKLHILDTIMQGPQSADKQFENGVYDALTNNKPLTEAQRSYAYGHGLLQAPQVLQTQDGLNNYITSVGPDGKVLWKTKVGHQFHEDQAAAAGRIMQVQQKQMFDLYKKANPDMSDADAWKMVSGGLAKNKDFLDHILGQDPKQTEIENVALDKAMKSIWTKEKGPQAEAQRQIWSNLVTPPPDGNMAASFQFPGTVAPMMETGSLWWKKSAYAGGVDAAGLRTQANTLRTMLAGALRDNNPKMTPEQIRGIIERAVPLPEGGNEGPQAMAAPPTQQSGTRATGIGPQPMSAPPSQGGESDPMDVGIQ